MKRGVPTLSQLISLRRKLRCRRHSPFRHSPFSSERAPPLNPRQPAVLRCQLLIGWLACHAAALSLCVPLFAHSQNFHESRSA